MILKIYDPAKTFFVSDTHFYHENIIKYCNRPFNSVDEMNSVLVSNWNSTLSNDDWVFFLGDFVVGAGNRAEKNQRAIEMWNKLNGNKFFIRGNHDHGISSILKFDNVGELKYKKLRIGIGHHPIDEFDYDLFIHGHIHNNPLATTNNKLINVSVEATDYAPVSLKDILDKLTN